MNLVNYPIFESPIVLFETEQGGYTRLLGTKKYEFTNHLGNVLSIFCDVKVPLDNNSDGVVDSYRVYWQNTSDYSPFGVSLDGRAMQRESYRYGFNGQEETAEISGDGNHTTAQYWEYDTRLGRRWNLDPKPNPSISNYAGFANHPILYADPLGDTLRGVSKVSAMRTRNEILNTFQGEKFDAFKKLIQIDFVYASNKVHYNRISTPAELISHELLGHGVGRVLGTTGYFHNDAIQMSNLYWRVRGYKTFYRDGTYHGSQVVLSPQTAQKIPTHYN